jgi:hypothetical protein
VRYNLQLVYSVNTGGRALRQPKAMRYRVQARCFSSEEEGRIDCESQAQKRVRVRAVRGPAVCVCASRVGWQTGRETHPWVGSATVPPMVYSKVVYAPNVERRRDKRRRMEKVVRDRQAEEGCSSTESCNR